MTFKQKNYFWIGYQVSESATQKFVAKDGAGKNEVIATQTWKGEGCGLIVTIVFKNKKAGVLLKDICIKTNVQMSDEAKRTMKTLVIEKLGFVKV